jgi:hypothetical protein
MHVSLFPNERTIDVVSGGRALDMLLLPALLWHSTRFAKGKP